MGAGPLIPIALFQPFWTLHQSPIVQTSISTAHLISEHVYGTVKYVSLLLLRSNTVVIVPF